MTADEHSPQEPLPSASEPYPGDSPDAKAAAAVRLVVEDERLTEVLHRSREFGFLGPGHIEPQRDNALAFLDALTASHSPARILDLGSGGGVPGLVLAVALPHTQFTLLDAMQRRCAFLEEAVSDLGLTDRVDVACGRAEELARTPSLRGSFDAVVSRSFGSPALAAECAAGFLAGPGARLLVSEPPTGSAERWPESGLAELGLRPIGSSTSHGGTVQVIEAVSPCPDRYPRRTGIPAKRPLF